MDQTPGDEHHAESAVTLREFQPVDTEALIDALVAVREHGGTYPSPVTCGPGRDEIAGWLERSGARWRAVAEVDGKVVGHVQLVPLSGDSSGLAAWLCEHAGPAARGLVELERLFVHPSWSGTGIGAALLRHAEQYARAQGHPMALWVLTSQHAAVALYRRHGWHHAGTCVTHPAGDLEVFLLPTEPAGAQAP